MRSQACDVVASVITPRDQMDPLVLAHPPGILLTPMCY